ncbi:hypothetical protein AB0K51_00305 [Kitasatospora sp. NPDC049285]|uniref:hypothetical protein n=1 Tax=Kitasatospora sp. NPDC049285 TaxID=3157096 RepID=UPI0034347E05
MADEASTAGHGRRTVDEELTVKLPPNGFALEQTLELPPDADPFDPALSGTRTIPLPPGHTPAAGTAIPTVPPPPSAPPAMPPAPPVTGWTGVMPAITITAPPPPGTAARPAATAPAAANVQASHGIGGGLRGRILVIEGGYGGGRRWGRGGTAHASVLSAALAGVAPQVLLSADQVDAVHLPGAADPQTVLAHLRAAARHPGPLLIHLGGHLITDRRGGQLYLSLREAKPADSLPWSAIATELRHRGSELDTLVIGDLSADQVIWPQLSAGAGQQLADGVPLWATVSHDPDQLGTFTRALIEALQRGRPGAEPLLSPELLRQQVHSVLRPDTLLITAHPAYRPYFRNTARQLGPADPAADAAPAGTPAGTTPAAGPLRPRLAPGWTPRGLVSLRKPGVPATPPRPARPVSLRKGCEPPLDTEAPAADGVQPTVRLGKDTAPPAAEETGRSSAASWYAGYQAAEAADAVSVVDFAKAEPAGVSVSAGATASASDSAAASASASSPESSPKPKPVQEHRPEPEPSGIPARHDPAASTVPLTKHDPAAATVPLEKPAPRPTADVPSAAAPPTDYLEAIGEIVRSAEAGQHVTATALALDLEEQAVAAHGALAPLVLQVRQVRAHVARVAGQPVLAAELYRQVAAALLTTEGPEHPETQRAATNAEACWRAVKDPAEAIRIAPDIIELRAYLPGPENRKLRAAERYLRQLADRKANAAL